MKLILVILIVVGGVLSYFILTPNKIFSKHYKGLNSWNEYKTDLPPCICSFTTTHLNKFEDSCKKYSVGDLIK